MKEGAFVAPLAWRHAINFSTGGAAAEPNRNASRILVAYYSVALVGGVLLRQI